MPIYPSFELLGIRVYWFWIFGAVGIIEAGSFFIKNACLAFATADCAISSGKCLAALVATSLAGFAVSRLLWMFQAHHSISGFFDPSAGLSCLGGVVLSLITFVA